MILSRAKSGEGSTTNCGQQAELWKYHTAYAFPANFQRPSPVVKLRRSGLWRRAMEPKAESGAPGEEVFASQGTLERLQASEAQGIGSVACHGYS